MRRPDATAPPHMLEAHPSRILHLLMALGVAKAGAKDFDRYKD